MSDPSSNNLTDLTELTVELLSAFVANNNVRSDDLPALIAATHGALSGLQGPGAASDTDATVEYQPAVSVRKSLADRDFIVSMVDGKRYKSLKRHLTGHGMTPEEYRERYKLPSGYPMVAPGYSDARREVAKRLGLGRKPRQPEEAKPAKPAKLARKPRVAKQPDES